jgi:transcriptional regulator with XRE-family HTH domain
MSTTTTENPVKEIRVALKLTQYEMAKRMGCSITSERRFEYQRTLPTVVAVKANLRKLAKQAGVEIDTAPAAK